MLEIIEKSPTEIYTEEDLVVGSFLIYDKSTSYVIGCDKYGNKKLLIISNIGDSSIVIRDSHCEIHHILDDLNNKGLGYKLYKPNQVKMTLEVG